MTTLTGDLGLAIRDFIEGKEFRLFDVDCNETDDSDTIEIVDCSDRDNLRVVTGTGARFVVRIIREG